MISQEQLLFLSNKENFRLKNQVDASVNKLLYDFQDTIFELLSQTQYSLPTKLSKRPGKVTKGNNLKGFPFQVSDFPSAFNKPDIFSFRTTIWYGHFFSFSLILGGKTKQNHIVDFGKLVNKGYSFVTNETIWETDLKNIGAIDINDNEVTKIIELSKKSEGFKIFKAYELNHIDGFKRLGVECFNDLLSRN